MENSYAAYTLTEIFNRIWFRELGIWKRFYSMKDLYIKDRLLKQRIHKWPHECSRDCKYMAEKYVYPTKLKRTPVYLVHRGRNTFSFTITLYCRRVYSASRCSDLHHAKHLWSQLRYTMYINQDRFLPRTKNRYRRKILTGKRQNTMSARGRVNKQQSILQLCKCTEPTDSADNMMCVFIPECWGFLSR